MNASELLRKTRRSHGLDQRALARRAGTTQAQISRIERGVTSPSVDTVSGLMTAMGERLSLDATTGPRGNRSTTDLRDEYESLSPVERILQAGQLSEALTTIAGGKRVR